MRSPGAAGTVATRRMPRMVRERGRFVGRDAELERLAAAYTEAAAGRGTMLLLEASSGMGASRLVDEALARLTHGTPGAGIPPPATVLRSDALPSWRGRPYGPICVALERGLQEREPGELAGLLGLRADVLAPLLPGSVLRAGLDPSPPPAEHRLERTLEGLRGLIARLAEAGPLVLVLEDLHATDAATRALVAFLARTLGDRPVLLVGTYQADTLGRTHPLRSTLREIDGGPRPPIRIPLLGLDRPALGALIEAHEGERPSAPLLLLVAERSGGNPLVAEEVLAARRELATSSLSAPLEQLIRIRVGRRSPECRRVLRALGLAGGPLLPQELAAIAAAYDSGQPRQAPRSTSGPRRGGAVLDADLTAGLEEARATRFAVDEPGRQDGAATRYRIRHELIAGALAADLLPAQRRWMHVAVACALVAHPEEAERHWLRAHEPARALAAALEAARAAESLGASADALGHLELAIELEATDPGTTVRPDLLVRAAEAAEAAADHQRAAAFLDSALAVPIGADRPSAAALWERLGDVRWAAGDRDEALVGFERAEHLLHAAGPVDRARVLARMAQARMLTGAFSDAERLAREALASTASAGPDGRAIVGHATCTLGALDGWHGRVDSAIRLLREALEVAIEVERPDDAFRARANLATILALEGRHEEAIDATLAGIAAAERDGLEDLHGNLLRGQAADFLFVVGRWPEAREIALRALAWAPTGEAFVNAAANFLTVDAEMTYGTTATRILGRLLLELETVADAQAAIEAQWAAASMALWRGDTTDARRAIETAWARIRETEDWVLQAQTARIGLGVAATVAVEARDRRDIATLAGVRTWGDEVLADATHFVERAGVSPHAYSRREADAQLATARAFRARIAGHDDPTTWQAVATRWEGLRRRYEVALARWRGAEAILAATTASRLRREARDEALAPLLEAAETAAELGAMPLLRAVRDVAERARIALPEALFAALGRVEDPRGEPLVAAVPLPVPPGPPPGGAASRSTETFGLSARERGVLAEIVSGRTNREIGERLYISEKTVGVHVGNILAKLGVAGRVEAATVALRLGLVDDLAQDSKRPEPTGSGRMRGRGREG